MANLSISMTIRGLLVNNPNAFLAVAIEGFQIVRKARKETTTTCRFEFELD